MLANRLTVLVDQLTVLADQLTVLVDQLTVLVDQLICLFLPRTSTISAASSPAAPHTRKFSSLFLQVRVSN